MAVQLKLLTGSWRKESRVTGNRYTFTCILQAQSSLYTFKLQVIMRTEKCYEAIRRSNCPISSALDTIGDKWSLLILRDLMFTDKRTYGEFQASEEGIATNILATRLTTLESNGIISKAPDPENGRRSIYRLTEKGIDLLPVIVELNHWMMKWDAAASPCSDSLKDCGKSKATLITAQMQKLKKEHLGISPKSSVAVKV
jgi:DNA-binding HxlR family transcriptional regulator